MLRPGLAPAMFRSLPRLLNQGSLRIPIKGSVSRAHLLKSPVLNKEMVSESLNLYLMIAVFPTLFVVFSSGCTDEKSLNKTPFREPINLNVFNEEERIESSDEAPVIVKQGVVFNLLKDMMYFGVARGLGSIVLAQPFQRLMSLAQKKVPFNESVKIVFGSIKAPYQGATSTLFYFGFIGAILYPLHDRLSQNLDLDIQKSFLKALLAFVVYALATPLDKFRFQAATQKQLPLINQSFSNQMGLFTLNGLVGFGMEGANDFVKTVVLKQECFVQMGIKPADFTQVVLGALASNVAGYPFLFAARHAYIKGFGDNPLKFNGVVARLCVVEASYLGFQAVMKTLDCLFSEPQEKKSK